MKQAIAIVRVSTSEQAMDERFSLPHQKKHIQDECERKGFTLVKTFEFVQSGARVMKAASKEREQILKYIEKNHVDAVVVHELDRLARNILDALLFVDELNRRKVVFVSVHDGFDTSTAQGQLQMQILAAFAEYFLKQLSAKVLGGMIERARQGKPMGRIPYGYRIGPEGFEINEEQAQVVRRAIFLPMKIRACAILPSYLI